VLNLYIKKEGPDSVNDRDILKKLHKWSIVCWIESPEPSSPEIRR
jgi:hypothetical protein